MTAANAPRSRARRRAPVRRETAAPGRPPAIDIVIDCPMWKAHRGVKAVLHQAIAAAASLGRTSGGELAIVLTDDSAVRVLNRDWRGKDRATNVLSFPAPVPARRERAGTGAARGRSGRQPSRLLGDIVIAYQTVAREAQAEDKAFRHHLAHLAVHGFFHLLGHDHVAEAEAEAMEALEIAALARLKVPNPYRGPILAGARSTQRPGRGT